MLPAIRGGLTVDDKLYGAPFYGESAFLMYRTDLFEKAGLLVPENPTWSSSAKTARITPTSQPASTSICLLARLAGAKMAH